MTSLPEAIRATNDAVVTIRCVIDDLAVAMNRMTIDSQKDLVLAYTIIKESRKQLLGIVNGESK